MPVSENPSARHARLVQLWLLAVAALIFVTLIVGGATRLTESGLSITEWKPVTGVLPPVTDEGWQQESAKYREIPQYRELNRGMSLGEFKTIYWWEWSHRLLARLVGAVFLLPFLFFLWRGAIPRPLQTRLWIIFAGGAALGAVGWWMVSSGLAGSARVSVSQYRLAFHLTLACAIYAAILWTAREFTFPWKGEVGAKRRTGVSDWNDPLPDPPPFRGRGRLGYSALIIVIFVLLQIYLGALVAGLDAGKTFNTWPLIDGAFIPSGERLWFTTPWWRNLFENTLTVQFDHRMVAYAIWAGAIAHAFDAWKAGGEVVRGALILAGLVTAQAALGIATLLHVAPLGLSLAHQGLAVIVLTAAVIHAQALHSRAGTRRMPDAFSLSRKAKAT
jgi:cytochrome c oxidase assembly protein subunit 15